MSLLVVQSKLSNCWQIRSNFRSVRARRAIFGLNVHIKESVGYLPPSLAFKMFNKQIRPILDYACEVCYTGKVIFKIYTTCQTLFCTPAVYAECGRFPLVIKHKIQALKYWKRLLESDNTTAIRNAYNSLYESFTYGQVNWCTYIKNIFVEANNIEFWNDQCISNSQIIEIKNKLHKNFIFKIQNDIFNSDKFPKLRTYKKFKTDFRFENHLVALENQGHQIVLSKFRISSHNLRIETGRYDNPKSEPNERLCIFCDMQVVEDEKHFLLECPLYTDHTTLLLHVCYTKIKYFGNMNQNEKFMKL